MRIIESTDEQDASLPAIRLEPAALRKATSPLAIQILELLAGNPDGLHASSIARELKEPEQKIHYHTTNLRNAGIIRIDHLKDTSGGTAKVLMLKAPALYARFAEPTPVSGRRHENASAKAFLSPFIEEGRWNARIVVSSPDPHGPDSARGKDAVYAVDLALLLGTFIETIPRAPMVLDTQLANYNENLIIIGGPVVNKAAAKINAVAPVSYDIERKEFVKGKMRYSQDNLGIICKFRNPLSKGKWILWIAGKRYSGTKAATLAFLHEFPRICEGNAHLILGIDADSDGNVDSVRFID